jgi:predicted porin
LLPNYLTVSGKTRQNDLDVTFLISIQPGAATSQSGTLGLTSGVNMNQRQAFLTFGDASWGSFKLGKDLGIYASDAILNDMTLLGVGQGAAGVGNTTLGRIGAGYMYADWKSQISYTSANFNGFSFTAGVTQAWNATDSGLGVSSISTARGGNEPAFEGKVSYAFAGDVSGKVWASGISQQVQFASTDKTASAWDLGANVNMAGFGLTGYYGEGKGLGTTFQLQDGFDSSGNKRDSKDWYVQGTYALPGVGTKLGVSYGESKLEGNTVDTVGHGIVDVTNEMWTVGAYHPLTKHLNLVAEYSEQKLVGSDDAIKLTEKAKTMSLGAILFF